MDLNDLIESNPGLFRVIAIVGGLLIASRFFSVPKNSLAAGIEWELREKTFTFCFTPFNFGIPKYLNLNSSSKKNVHAS
mgnify:CR=1 FL=1